MSGQKKSKSSRVIKIFAKRFRQKHNDDCKVLSGMAFLDYNVFR